MGFIRVKTEIKKGKEYRYYYYSERRRSHVKDGGDGKVRSIDKLIGGWYIGGYLSFWLWDGLTVRSYVEAFVEHRLKGWRLDNCIQWKIAWKQNKSKVISARLSIRAKYKNGQPLVDARSSSARKIKHCLQEEIDEILYCDQYVAERIKETAYNLACYQHHKKALEKAEAEYSEWLSNPDKEFWIDGRPHVWADDAGDTIQTSIEILRSFIESDLRQYQGWLDSLINSAPPRERQRFKATIIRQTEKLASSPNFRDRYRTEQGW
jgi:hypothetical protein